MVWKIFQGGIKMVDKYADVTAICQELVKVKSYSGEEAQVVKIIEEIMTIFEFDEVIKDRYGNIYGIMQGSFDGPTQLYDAHIDTVVVSDASKWSHNPFSGDLKDGKIYGRGTSDMKGALGSMLVATRDFAALTNKQFKGRICVAGVVHEEFFEGVASREISKNLAPDYVVIGEASSLNVKHGQRGRGEIIVETFGKPAHSANPEHGINAVYHMSEVIQKIKDLPIETDEHLGKGILVLTDIKSSPYPGSSVVPDYCKSTWDRRLLVGDTKESVLAPIQKVIDHLMKKIPGFIAKVSLVEETVLCYTGEKIGDERFFPAWYYEPEENFVKNAHQALLAGGLKSKLTRYDFCTNGSHYAGEAQIKTIGFGPSEEYLAHIIDEYIEVEQLEIAVKGYQILMETLSNEH